MRTDDFPPPPHTSVELIVSGEGPPPGIVQARAELEVWTSAGQRVCISIPSTDPVEAAGHLRWLAAWITDDRLDAEGQRGHVIHLAEKGAALMHPSECRPDLFACPYEVARSVLEDPGQRGYYRCTLDENGWLVIGLPVAP